MAEIRLDGKPVQLALWDTACVVCFSVVAVADVVVVVVMVGSGQEEYEVGVCKPPLSSVGATSHVLM